METGKLHFDEARRREWPFFLVMVVFWVFLGILLFLEGYHGAFKWVNHFQFEPINWASLNFFTHLGDGLILPALIILLFWRRDPALVISFVIALFFTAAITQFGKRVLFDDWMRPGSVFKGVSDILIYDPNPPMEHSFPSGHATSAATGGVFFAWALYSYQKYLPWLVGLLTAFLCLTRVFIGAHFPGDILVGSMIGSLGSLLVLLLAYPFIKSKLVAYPKLTGTTLGYLAMGFAILLILGQFANILLKH